MTTFRKIWESELVRNSSKLISANVIAQVICLLVYPLLTRLFTQADFGLANLFVSIGAVLLILSTAEYQYAIPLPNDERRAVGAFHAGMTVLLCIVLLLCISLPFSSTIAGWFDTPQLAGYLWLMPIYVGSIGLWQLLNYWFTRQKQFGHISGYQFSQNVVSVGGKLAFGAGSVSGGLLYAAVGAPVITLLGSSIVAGKHIKPLMKVDKTEMTQAAKEYRKFPFFSLPRALMNSLGASLPSLMLSGAFGMTAIGLLSMAFTLAFRPINIISASLYQVFIQRFAAKVTLRHSISKVFRKFILYAIVVTLPVFAILYAVLPPLTEWLLGDGWRVTGEYIRLLLPWIFLSVMAAPLGCLVDVFQQQKKSMVIELIYVLLRAAGLAAGIVMNDIKISILGYSIAGVIILSYLLLWYGKLVSTYEKSIVKE